MGSKGTEDDLGLPLKAFEAGTRASGKSGGRLYWARLTLACLVASCSSLLGGAPSALAGTCSNDALRVGASAALPECRAYEQVSPVDKENVDVAEGGASKVAVSGNGLVYTAYGAFAGSPASSYNFYLARRGASGWLTEPLTATLATRPIGLGVSDQFFQFTDELSAGLVSHYNLDEETALATPPEPSDTFNFYRRDNLTGSYETVTTVAPLGAEPGGYNPLFGAATPDLGHVAWSGGNAAGPYFPDDPGSSVYAWTPETGMTLASIDPETGEPFSSAGVGDGTTGYQDPHSISADGSRIFFSVPFSSSGPLGQIYVREGQGQPGATTRRLSRSLDGTVDPAGEQPAPFLTATPDGSKVLFKSTQKLTADSTASAAEFASDLYLLDLDANGGAGSLTDLTTSDPSGARVEGLVGASEDLSRIYFVAQGDLDGVGSAVAAQMNLYLWTAGEGTRFVAKLAASEDQAIWSPQSNPGRQSRVSPDGQFLTFATISPVDSSFDNVDPTTLLPHREIYFFDAAGSGPICASCQGSGPALADSSIKPLSTSSGVVPETGPADLIPRNLLPDGSRLYFESAERLLPGQDINGRKPDVYQYDSASGSLSLISTGRSSSPSVFTGASPDGSDVFFTTREQLLPSDRDELLDVYDARVGGGFAKPPSPTAPCEDDACQGEVSLPPAAPAPGSSAIVAPPGKTQKPKRCRKGTHKVRAKSGKTRCVKNGKKRGQKANSRRVGR